MIGRVLKEAFVPFVLLLMAAAGFAVGWSAKSGQARRQCAEALEANDRAHGETVSRLKAELAESQARELDGWKHANKIANLAAKALGERR